MKWTRITRKWPLRVDLSSHLPRREAADWTICWSVPSWSVSSWSVPSWFAGSFLPMVHFLVSYVLLYLLFVSTANLMRKWEVFLWLWPYLYGHFFFEEKMEEQASFFQKEANCNVLQTKSIRNNKISKSCAPEVDDVQNAKNWECEKRGKGSSRVVLYCMERLPPRLLKLNWIRDWRNLILSSLSSRIINSICSHICFLQWQVLGILLLFNLILLIYY